MNSDERKRQEAATAAAEVDPGVHQLLESSRSDPAELYKDYCKSHSASFCVFDETEYRRLSRKYRALYRRFLPTDRGASILDVGCGVGHFLWMLEAEGFTNCAGIDASVDQLEVCRQHVRLPVLVTDASSYLKQNPQSKDCIVAMHIIEHFSDTEARAFLRAAREALRPQGVLIVATPNADCVWAGHCLFDDLTHKRLYTPRTLRQLLHDAGFRNVEFHPEGAVPYDLATFFRWFFASLLYALRKIQFVLEVGPGRSKRATLIVTPGQIAVSRLGDSE